MRSASKRFHVVLLMVLALCPMFANAEDTVLAADGKAAASIVIADAANPIAVFAAEELAYHVRQAAGAALLVVHEPLNEPLSGPAVYVGATAAARAAGMVPDANESEQTILRTVGRDLYIVGNEDKDGALDTTRSGTLWGVYEILERYLGVRWLWPGPLGEYIPATDTVTIPALDETFSPRFDTRFLRPGLGRRGFTEGREAVCFSPEQSKIYADNQNLFLRRHRMGRSESAFRSQRSFGSGHAFESWWEQFGAEHPEWFQLLPNGKRGPEDPAKPRKVTMCVSNPEFHKKIVELWQLEREKHPGKIVNIAVSENDTSARCVCESCQAWDGPQPEVSSLPPGLERSYEPMQASNRYARFALAVYELASKIDPKVRVHTYAYLNFFWAPSPEITLNPNIVVGFVPWFRGAGWFPRTDAEQEWIKQQWSGWQRTGASVYYRPNWFLDGYTMPLVYPLQFADAFQFYARNGMTGTDFDSLQGQWAAQGTNLYVLARIHVRPEMPVDAMLQEYYDAFGPAVDAVKQYFTYWEDYATKNSPRAVESIRSRRDGAFRRYALYALVADELYPLECFEPGQALLAHALDELKAGNAETQYVQRVEFLQQGLQHARQCVLTAAVVNNPVSSTEQRKKALSELIALRRSLEGTGIANMDRAGIIETDSWKDVEGIWEP